MNVVQKRLSMLALMVLSILFACVSLYGQDRYVFYFDSVPNLHLLYGAEINGGWKDVTWGNTIAPTSSVSALTLVNHNGAAELFYIDTNYNIEEQFEVSGTSWGEDDVTYEAGAPAPMAGSALTSFIDATFVTHVFYEGTNGHVYELYNTGNPGQGTWHSDDPTSLARAPVATSGSALTSFIDSGVMHVFYLGTNNNVYELYWTGGTAWHSDDPTSLAGAPVATSGSALTSFANTSGNGDTGMHVMYLGTNEHVYALHSTSAWGYFDATAASGGVPATNGSKLMSFQDTYTGGVHLYFIGQNAHVYELYWPSEGAASETDLTVASGAGATAAMGSGLAGSGHMIAY